MKKHRLVSGSFMLTLALCIAFLRNADAQPIAPNIDFSMGNFTNWKCYTGTSISGTPATGPYFTSPVLSGPIGGTAPGGASPATSRHAITTGSDTDYYGGFPIVAVGGGTYSMRIGNDDIGAQAERIVYHIHVPAGTTKFSMQYQFAVVFEDPGHLPEEQPSFRVIAYDSATGAILPSANNLYISGPGLPGFKSSARGFGDVIYHTWMSNTLNLSGMGGKTVSFEVTSVDCSPAGHFSYGYFDAGNFISYLAPVAVACNLNTNTIQFQAPRGYKYYHWFNQNYSTPFNSATDTNSTITLPFPSTAQYYNLVLTPYFSGGTPDTIRTNVMSGFSISTSPSVACAAPGGHTQLFTTVTGGSGSYTYNWTGDTASMNALNVSNPVVSPIVPGVYIVKVTDTNGCFRRDTVRVNIGSFHVNAGPDATTCLGSTLNLSGSASPAFSGYSYNWTPAANLSSATVNNPVFTPSAAGMQQLVLRVDSASCSLYDTVNVRVLSNSFTVNDDTTCSGTTVLPFIQGDTAFSYSWSPSSRLSFPTPVYPGSDQHPSFAADTTTTFTITAQHSGCSNIVKQLTVHVDPSPLVSLGSDTVFKTSLSTVSISASVTPAWFSPYTYSWNANGFIDSPTRANIVFSGLTDTMLYVTVSTPAGCTGSDSVQVIVNLPSIAANVMSIPNAFTPGTSINPMFRVVHINPGYTFRSMRVYNRWGRKLYETNNMNDGWDGTFKGTMQQIGVYAYVLEAVSSTGKTVFQQGSVTLIR